MSSNERKYRIRDMESLDDEIDRLKLKCRDIEGKFDENIDQLKDNYAMMAFNSVIGNRLKAVPLVGDIAAIAINNEKVQNFIQELIDKLIKKSSGAFEKLAIKIFPGKSSKSE
ncbi:MAG: hypothetical protein C5B52_16900 [Bacteroidetes bacterium]|nr:MAG: hypothetical protein C5B52_16900 [Bacteroidota bacterium]